MIHEVGKAVADAALLMIALAAVGGGLVVGLIFWGLPLAWDWLKPVLHAVTA